MLLCFACDLVGNRLQQTFPSTQPARTLQVRHNNTACPWELGNTTHAAAALELHMHCLQQPC